MQRIESVRKAGKPLPECWVDVFEGDYFTGRRRRVHGPKKMRQLQGNSLIVGPGAVVMLSVVKKKGNSKSSLRAVKLKSKRILPDLVKALGGTVFREVMIENEVTK